MTRNISENSFERYFAQTLRDHSVDVEVISEKLA